nr:MAG TPA: hypothetical protein [Caudoviricetes sp.]
MEEDCDLVIVLVNLHDDFLFVLILYCKDRVYLLNKQKAREIFIHRGER